MPDRFSPFRIGRYECVELLGVGGMASVYRARLRTVAGFEKFFALKKIHQHLAQMPQFVEMFIREAKISATLEHGNIVQLIELDAIDGDYFMVMEYVDGVNLRWFLDRLKDRSLTIPWELTVFLISEVAKGLHYAHTLTDPAGKRIGIVHRDLSPSNVMVSRQGQVKILDFGIAKALWDNDKSRSRELKGKYAYMSPEQIHNSKIDARSDLFSLGTIFYEMLSGDPLFDADSIPATIRKVEEAMVPPIAGVEPLIEPILPKLMARDPAGRYESALEVAEVLSRIPAVRGKVVGEMNLARYFAALDGRLQDSKYMDEVGDNTSEVTLPERLIGSRSRRWMEEESSTSNRYETSDSGVGTTEVYERRGGGWQRV